jgi:hypothetical protein
MHTTQPSLSTASIPGLPAFSKHVFYRIYPFAMCARCGPPTSARTSTWDSCSPSCSGHNPQGHPRQPLGAMSDAPSQNKSSGRSYTRSCDERLAWRTRLGRCDRRDDICYKPTYLSQTASRRRRSGLVVELRRVAVSLMTVAATRIFNLDRYTRCLALRAHLQEESFVVPAT